jgi:hypothetical protein
MTGPAHGGGARPEHERAGAQAGTRDDAGTPGLWTLLWALLGGAVVWSLHLLASYVLLAYACTTDWRAGARTTLAAASVVAVALTAWSAVVAWRRWHIARALDRPVDDAWDARMGERTARVSFLMVVGLVSAIVFGIGIVYEAITLWFVPLCEPGVSS